MNLGTVLLIAFGLAMDAFAVAVAGGFAVRCLRLRYALRIAFWFGFFQAVMPIAGWLAGVCLRGLIGAFDHWIAFGLLALIGGKMIYESFKFEKSDQCGQEMKLGVLLILAVATSIDALAVGLSLSMLNVVIMVPAILIGLVTFALSFAGVCIGNRFGHFCEKRIELFGGLLLIGIGVKILIQHL